MHAGNALEYFSGAVRFYLFYLFLIATLLVADCGAQTPARKRVLVYSRQTSSPSTYIHENAASSVEAIRKMGAEHGFIVDASEDPSVFTTENLKRYAAVVFSNTNNFDFDSDAQREAFQKYIEGGGGFVGLHAATTSERQWPFFVSTIGGRFLRHPEKQKFRVVVEDANHLATRNLPSSFEWEDECYFHVDLNPDMHVLLSTDPSLLNDPEKGKFPQSIIGGQVPLAWTITSHGHRTFYSALGHPKESYSNPLLVGLIQGGILWVLDGSK